MGRSSSLMRLFFALGFSPETGQQIQKVQDNLRQYAPQARFPDPETFHITLAFLGEVPPQKLDQAKTALNGLNPLPMTLRFGRMGKFSQQEGDVWWLGVDPDPALFSLQEELVKGLRAQGFSLEKRNFKPHVTLARKVLFQDQIPRKEALLPQPIYAPCGRVSLMSSQLRPQGPLYKELAGKSPGLSP